jgi:hypothetical protein
MALLLRNKIRYLPVACICSGVELQWQMKDPEYVARTLLRTEYMVDGFEHALVNPHSENYEK